MISKYYDEPIAGYFGIDKTKVFIIQKYYWSIFQVDLKIYIKRCNICLASKMIQYKSYRNLHLLPVPMHK